MIYTKQAIKLFEDFSIFMVFEFLNTLKNRKRKVRSIKTSTKTKLVKETSWQHPPEHVWPIKQICNNEHNEVTWEIEFKEWYRHQWSYTKIQTSDHQEVLEICLPFGCQCWWTLNTQSFPPPSLEWSDTRSYYALISSVELDLLTNLWHSCYHKTHT